MDNGQPVQSPSAMDFFTTGAGTNSEDAGNFEAENNLNSNNQDWGSPLERNSRGIGGAAINSHEPLSGSNLEMLGTPEDSVVSSGIGEVVDLAMPPGVKIEDESPQADDAGHSFDKKGIKTGETLGKTGIREVDQAIGKLNQDGDVADFYNTIRDMMEVNIENSYGENATWKGGKAA